MNEIIYMCTESTVTVKYNVMYTCIRRMNEKCILFFCLTKMYTIFCIYACSVSRVLLFSFHVCPVLFFLFYLFTVYCLLYLIFRSLWFEYDFGYCLRSQHKVTLSDFIGLNYFSYIDPDQEQWRKGSSKPINITV